MHRFEFSDLDVLRQMLGSAMTAGRAGEGEATPASTAAGQSEKPEPEALPATGWSGRPGWAGGALQAALRRASTR